VWFPRLRQHVPAIARTRDHRFVMAGRIAGSGVRTHDFRVARVDAGGSVLTDTKRGPLRFAHGREEDEKARDILVLDPDPVTGAMVVVGQTDSDLWSAGGLDSWALFISHDLVALRGWRTQARPLLRRRPCRRGHHRGGRGGLVLYGPCEHVGPEDRRIGADFNDPSPEETA